MADGYRKWPGETDAEFQERLVQEEHERMRADGDGEKPRGTTRVVRPRRTDETDEAFAQRVLDSERERVRKQRYRSRHRTGRAQRASTAAGHVPGHVPSQRPDGHVPSSVPPKRPDVSQPDGTAKVIRISDRKLTESGAKHPTLNGIPIGVPPDEAAIRRDHERDNWRDKNGTGPRTFLEGGVGGEGLSPVFPPPSEGKTEGQTENLDGTRDTEGTTSWDTRDTAAAGEEQRVAPPFQANGHHHSSSGGDASGGDSGDSGGRDNGDGTGHTCPCAAALSRMEAEQRMIITALRDLAGLAQGAMKMAVTSMARAEGLARLVLSPVERADAEIPKGLEKEADAALAADKGFDEVTEIRIGEHGQLVPVDPDAVLAASSRVQQTTAALLGAARTVPDEPHVDEALDHAWRMMMFLCYVTSNAEAARPLSEAEMYCLREMLRAAEMYVSAERGETPFGMLARWIDLYARDAQLKASQKSPENMLVRLQFYAQASYPKESVWTPSKVVQAWRQITGRPTSPAAQDEVKPGENDRG